MNQLSKEEQEYADKYVAASNKLIDALSDVDSEIKARIIADFYFGATDNSAAVELRKKCYDLALKSIHRDYSTLSTTATGGLTVEGLNAFEPNYTKKAQEIYDYITEGKVAQ